jgi:N6-L-threonylcarbamoyladenine synthase
VERINDVIAEALGKDRRSIDAIAVTTGPGLVGALLIGLVTARTLGWAYKVPVIGMNHLEGHLFAGLVEHPRLRPPFLGLIISGGHTELVIFKDYGEYQSLGGTRDDAAGEAFDKVANLLQLPFPGGPSIDRLARTGDPQAVAFPRAWLRGNWDFSFSGLKTAVANYLAANTNGHRPKVSDLCASFQEAVVDVLVRKTFEAAKAYHLKSIVIGGGVAANSRLRAAFQQEARQQKLNVYLPDISFCTDNAAMIAAGGYYKFKKLGKHYSQLAVPSVDANLPVTSWRRS